MTGPKALSCGQMRPNLGHMRPQIKKNSRKFKKIGHLTRPLDKGKWPLATWPWPLAVTNEANWTNTSGLWPLVMVQWPWARGHWTRTSGLWPLDLGQLPFGTRSSTYGPQGPYVVVLEPLQWPILATYGHIWPLTGAIWGHMRLKWPFARGPQITAVPGRNLWSSSTQVKPHTGPKALCVARVCATYGHISGPLALIWGHMRLVTRTSVKLGADWGQKEGP